MGDHKGTSQGCLPDQYGYLYVELFCGLQTESIQIRKWRVSSISDGVSAKLWCFLCDLNENIFILRSH